MSASITAKRKSESYINLTLRHFQNSTLLLTHSYGDAYLKNTAKGFDMIIGNSTVGVTDGSNLTIDISATDKITGVVKRTLLVCKKN